MMVLAGRSQASGAPSGVAADGDGPSCYRSDAVNDDQAPTPPWLG
jgi:hypothetical protein